MSDTNDRPHPADYMTDAQYEQFRRDGGLHYAEVSIDILNESHSPREELVIEEYSGEPSDVSDPVVEAVMERDDVLCMPSKQSLAAVLRDMGLDRSDAGLAAERFLEADPGDDIMPNALVHFILGLTDDIMAECENRAAEACSCGGAHDWIREEMGGGDWFTVVDGELVSHGESHPFRVEVQLG